MNNIKLFMLLILAATSSVAIADETPAAGYSFGDSSDGKTLTITAWGDLTTLGTSTSVQQFNSTAVNKVFVTDYGTSVTDGLTYQSAATYYLLSDQKQRIFADGELQNGSYLKNVTKYYNKWNNSAYQENTTYIYPVTLEQKQVWNESTANVEGTYIYPAYLNGTAKVWKESATTAADTYIYPVSFTSQEEWNASNVNLYQITGAPASGDVWTTSALTADNVYVYPATYNQYSKTYAWNSSKVNGKYLYTAYTDYAGNIIISGDAYNTSNNPSSDDQGNISRANTLATGGTVSGSYTLCSDTQLSNGSTVTIGNGISYATSDFIVETTPLTITATRLTSGPYQQPGTFTYDNTTYYNYILSTQEITQDVSFPITEIANHNVSLLTSMDAYHGNVTYVTLASDCIVSGTTQNKNSQTYSYDYGSGSQNYVYYITTSSADLASGATVNVSDITPLASIDSYRTTVYTGTISDGRYTTGAYTAPNAYYSSGSNISTYTRYYAKFTTAQSTNATFSIDNNVTVLTEEQLAQYWETKHPLYNNNSKTRMISGLYSAENDITYSETTYKGYVKLDNAWPASGDIYAEDSFVHFLTEEELANYLTTKTLVSRKDNANYVTSGSNYTAYDPITVGENTYTAYVKMSSVWPSTSVFAEDNPGIFLTQAQLEENYLDYTYKFWVNDGATVFKSTDSGQNFTTVDTYNEQTYDGTYTLWVDKYVAIDDNTYFNDGGNGESYLTTNTTSWYFKDELLNRILSGSYEKVQFKLDTEKGSSITIDPAIVQQILFPNSNANNTITELDLGEATTTSFAHLLDHPSDGWKRAQNLAKVTLPLVAAENNEVVLPANVIPSVYNTSSDEYPANLKTITVPVGYTKIAEKAFALARPGYTSGYGSAKITTINLPEGLKEIGDEAFYGITNLTNINITDDEVKGRSLVFPSKLATIGESAFEGCTSLASTEADPFILPDSLKTIKKSAFQNLTNLKFLELNEGLEYVGNTAFGLNAEVHDQTTITFPSTIKYLGPGSFISRWYQDIYFTGTSAPVCPLGKCMFTDWGNVTAFSANTQMGNNGFNATPATGSTADNASTGYANRENYINNGYYFTILHFPDSLPADSAKTYRDITRRYVTGTFDATTGAFSYAGYGSSIHDATDPNTKATYGSAFKEGATNGKSNLVYYMSSGGLLTESANADNIQPGFIDTYMGTQQIWPSQMQWTRNFVTVANGVEWDGTTKYRPTLTKDMFNWMKEDGLFVQANSLDYSSKRVADSTNVNNYGKALSLADLEYENLTDSVKDYLSLILYQGTRRFVLSYDGGYSIPFIVKLKGGRWWSICLPFNMTKAEVDSVFGGGNTGTHVCLMSAVERTVTNNSTTGNTLVLKFKNDVYRHKTERSVTKASGGKGLIYTYASNFSVNAGEPSDNDTVIYARESYMIYPVRKDAGTDPVEYDFGSPIFEKGNPLPTIVYSNSNAPYTTQNGSDPAYRFIGNFITSTGASTVKIPQYSYAYGRASASETKSKFFILSTAGATWSPFKSIVQNTAVGGGANDWNNFFQKTTARVNQVSLFGDDEEITGIDNVIIEVSSDNDEDFRVFNLNGSLMGNSLQGLPAGTYIQGGKAYRVK